MKTGQIIFIAVLFLVIGILISVWYVKANGVYYKLPKHGSPDQWGKYYWRSLHTTVEKIPCSICEQEATSFMKFFHDFVNNKREISLYDEENFKNWLNRLSELKMKLYPQNA